MNSMTRANWYQEPWMWFILTLLLLSVSGAILMSAIAIKHTPTEIKMDSNNSDLLIKRVRALN